jgi:hypothetical protein
MTDANLKQAKNIFDSIANAVYSGSRVKELVAVYTEPINGSNRCESVYRSDHCCTLPVVPIHCCGRFSDRIPE